MIFLIEYDRPTGRLKSMRTFEDESRVDAQKARLDRELDLNGRGITREVVLLEAANEQALRRTHARYFEDLDQLITRAESSTSAMLVRDTKD